MIIVYGYDNIWELLVKNVDMFLEWFIIIINGVFNKGKGIIIILNFICFIKYLSLYFWYFFNISIFF